MQTVIYRELLERSVSQSLSARKMKTLFTKFLQFEEAHGSKEGQDKVRAMASEFVKQVAGGDETMEEPVHGVCLFNIA